MAERLSRTIIIRKSRRPPLIRPKAVRKVREERRIRPAKCRHWEERIITKEEMVQAAGALRPEKFQRLRRPAEQVRAEEGTRAFCHFLDFSHGHIILSGIYLGFW